MKVNVFVFMCTYICYVRYFFMCLVILFEGERNASFIFFNAGYYGDTCAG